MLVKHIIDSFIPFFGKWGYLITFLVSFFESIPLLGFLCPGGSTIILSGFMARTHVLHIVPVILFASLGAFLGDMLAYFLGRLLGVEFIKKFGKYFFIKDKHIEKGKGLIEKHPGKTIILGRFNYITRSVGPFFMGTTSINPLVFISYNVLSALIWGGFYSAAGFAFGEGVKEASKFVSLISIAALVFIIIMFFVYRFVNIRHHVFRKYHVYTLFLSTTSVVFFTAVLQSLSEERWLYHLNERVETFLPHIQRPVLTEVMIFITSLADPINLAALCLLLFGILLYQRRWYHAAVAYFSLFFGVVGEYGIKAITHIERPAHGLVATLQYSFPSGHTTLATVFFLLIFYSFKNYFKTRSAKITFLLINLFLVLLVAISRVYLQAHWVTDVFGGFFLGVFSVTFFILVVRAVIFSENHLRRMIMKHEPGV